MRRCPDIDPATQIIIGMTRDDRPRFAPAGWEISFTKRNHCACHADMLLDLVNQEVSQT